MFDYRRVNLMVILWFETRSDVNPETDFFWGSTSCSSVCVSWRLVLETFLTSSDILGTETTPNCVLPRFLVEKREEKGCEVYLPLSFPSEQASGINNRWWSDTCFWGSKLQTLKAYQSEYWFQEKSQEMEIWTLLQYAYNIRCCMVLQLTWILRGSSCFKTVKWQCLVSLLFGLSHLVTTHYNYGS